MTIPEAAQLAGVAADGELVELERLLDVVEVRLHAGHARFVGLPHDADGHGGGEHADDRDHDHQLDEGKAAQAAKDGVLHEGLRVVLPAQPRT